MEKLGLMSYEYIRNSELIKWVNEKNVFTWL